MPSSRLALSPRDCSSISPSPHPSLFGVPSGLGCAPFVPASRHRSLSWQKRYARHFPNFSWVLQKAIPSRNSSPSGRTCKTCQFSAWLRKQKQGLLSTVYNYFVWWQCDSVLDRIHHALYVECRERAERETSPTAAIIDSQSVKSAEKDAMGRAARTMPPSSLQRINGAPHATAERFEQIPRNSRTRCNTNRRDRDAPVELAGRRYRAWRRALAVEEARGR